MIKINNIKLPIDHDENALEQKVKKLLKIKKIDEFKILKQAIDARKKENIFYVYNVAVAIENETKYLTNNNISLYNPEKLIIKEITKISYSPIIVGSGPAGLFAALILAEAGANPIIIERGKDVDHRIKDVELFWKNGKLNFNSNVQFGEGGAGTFSDGKLNTGIKDFRCLYVLEKLVEFGADKDILYVAKPHVGTDVLHKVLKNIRKRIIELGGSFLFEHQLIDIEYNQNMVLKQIKVKHNDQIKTMRTDDLILAIGHSARDTFRLLQDRKVNMEAKPFAIGVRIEHLQSMINNVQYGNNHSLLPAADYKLVAHLDNKRAAYTFCMCPGGLVVAASSEPGKVVTNGMSYRARDLVNANSALLVEVKTSDFKSDDAMAGMYLQEELEIKAFKAGGSNYNAPIQLVGDFMNKKETISIGKVKPSYLPGVKLDNFHNWMPKFISESLSLAIIAMDKKLPGFASDDAVLTAIETRSSSPVRIIRDKEYQSNIIGMIPCGEGAGYAGGIISAAVDGIHCASKIIEKYNKE